MFDPSMVRNIGIAAHIDAGKTTTTERILFFTGRTHRMGEVDSGTTITDFDEQEQERGITIYSAAVSCPWREFTINLIDTPGHVDFTAEVERSLRVLDGMVAVFDAKEGVEAQSETVWAQADKYGVPRICFINKMDKIGADFEWSVASIRKRLRAHPLVLQLPIGAAETLTGIIDLVEMKAVFSKDATGGALHITDIPEELVETARRHRNEMLEVLSETSEELMERFLGDEVLSPEDIRRAIRGATLRHELVPVLCGSALQNIGVQRVLDAVCDYLPSPLDVPPVTAQDANKPGVEHTLTCDSAGPLAAFVFKVVAEKPVDLCYLRIYSGTLKPNSRLLNTTTGEKENITRIVRMFAKRREQLDRTGAGDIVAVVGPKNSLTGDTLCDQRHPVKLETIEFPETVISVSVQPKSSKDREKFVEALSSLQRQDPTLAVSMNAETGQTLISGMGELHLEIMVQRLRTEMNVDVAVGKPRVSYREAVSGRAAGEGRFLKRVGGREHFAVVRLEIEPKARVDGQPNSEVSSVISQTAITPELRDALDTGVVEAAQSGVLGGYPVIDWKATLLSVEFDEEKSSALAFENAARAAFYDAMRRADPILLEPIMNVSVVTAEEYFGSILSDLNARNAVVRETQFRGQDRVILADVPLAQMFGYITKLRSLSQGRATSMMTPAHYAPMAKAEMQALVG